MKGRWFLAHTRKCEDADIDSWRDRLVRSLAADGWDAEVVPGRDDFTTRAAALGGWKSWCRDVPSGCRYDGDAMFHGVIVPASEQPVNVGKATASLVNGFLDEGKHAFVWDTATGSFYKVNRVVSTDNNDWKAWATLELDRTG